jgi:hypothetical protein
VDFYLPQTEQLQISSQKTDASGDLLPLSTWTTNGAGVASLAFCVSNGTSEAYAGDAMSFHIRLIASLGLQKAENLTVTLQYEGRTYIGTATAIPEGSGRYETFGPGWTFSFRDASGAEAAWTLAGGTLSKANFTLTVEGEAQYDSLLQIEVTGL